MASHWLRRALALAGTAAALLTAAAAARAAPVTVDFESGGPLSGQQVTNQYGAPGIPAGPTFMKGSDAGFTGLACGPPTLQNNPATANNGFNAVRLDGCPAGGEFWPTAGFFALGYSTDAVDFWVMYDAATAGPSDIVTTAFDANGTKLPGQVDTVVAKQNGPTYYHVNLSSASFNIAYIAVEYGTAGGNSNSPTGVGLTPQQSYLFLDDLTYDPPSSPPASSFRLGADPAAIGTDAGAQLNVKVQINWTNNPNPASSPVSLELTAPKGVTGSFSPTPTATGTSTLSLQIAKDVFTQHTSITVDGYVDKGTGSEKHSSVTIPLDIAAAFEIVPPQPTTLAPCTPRQLEIKFNTADNFTQPIDLAVTIAAGRGITILGISGGQVNSGNVVSSADTTITPQNDVASATVDIAVAPGFKAQTNAADLGIFAQSQGYQEEEEFTPLSIEAGHVSDVVTAGSNVTPSTVFSPAMGVQGSLLTLHGAGFCAGTKVAIGDPDQSTFPESVASDGTSLTFRVPRDAVTGPIHVMPAVGDGFDGPTLTVGSFRNTYGFSWPNGNYHTLMTEDMVDDLFGKDETNINVYGWLIRKPEASLFQTLVNKHVMNGLCFGMAYASLEMLDFPGEVASFLPSGSKNPWQLFGPGPFDPALLPYVIERFSLQDTDQILPIEINAPLEIHGPNDYLNEIQAGIAAHEPVLVALTHWAGLSTEGHAVLAYDTHPLPDGTTAIDILNSNAPYQPAEESLVNGNANSTHDDRVTKSEIIWNNGNWQLPDLGWSGSEADMVVYKHSDLPILNGHQPKLPNLFTSIWEVWFGSAGDGVTSLTGSGGSALVGNGKFEPRSKWPKDIAPLTDFTSHQSPLQGIGEKSGGGEVTADVQRSKGGGEMSLMLPGLQGQLQGGDHKGEHDQVSVNPHGDVIGYSSDQANSPFGGTLVASGGAGGASARASAASGLSDHVVQFKTSVAKGGGDHVSFPGGTQFVVAHAGKPATLDLTLQGFAADGQPIAVTLPPVHVGGGETLAVRPKSWRTLASSPIRETLTSHGHKQTHTVRGRVKAERFATVKSVALTKTAAQLRLAVRHAPAGAWLSPAITVSKGSRIVAKSVPSQVSGKTLRSGRITVALTKKLLAGRYTVRVKLLEATASGPLQGSVVVTRTLAARR